jgi:hypothetical protein
MWLVMIAAGPSSATASREASHDVREAAVDLHSRKVAASRVRSTYGHNRGDADRLLGAGEPVSRAWWPPWKYRRACVAW